MDFSGPRKKWAGRAPNGAGTFFFRHKKTLPTFWAERILILRILIFWIFLGSQISGLGPLGPHVGPAGRFESIRRIGLSDSYPRAAMIITGRSISHICLSHQSTRVDSNQICVVLHRLWEVQTSLQIESTLKPLNKKSFVFRLGQHFLYFKAPMLGSISYFLCILWLNFDV